MPDRSNPGGFSPRRRRLLAAAGLASFASATPAAPNAVLPTAVSLADALSQAVAKGEPLLVMVSLPGCPYCRAVRNQFLGPMHERQELSIVQVDMGSGAALKDFTGAMTTHEKLIRGWSIKVAPTVLFFGRNGVEVSERLEGASLPDFYGAYLDDRLEQGRKAVRV